jgi:hypothetical protein
LPIERQLSWPVQRQLPCHNNAEMAGIKSAGKLCLDDPIGSTVINHHLQGLLFAATNKHFTKINIKRIFNKKKHYNSPTTVRIKNT